MAGTVDAHLSDETTEQYSLGKTSARNAAEIEEHLLICETCRRAVAASDGYVAAMRAAAVKIRKAERLLRHKRSALANSS